MKITYYYSQKEIADLNPNNFEHELTLAINNHFPNIDLTIVKEINPPRKITITGPASFEQYESIIEQINNIAQYVFDDLCQSNNNSIMQKLKKLARKNINDHTEYPEYVGQIKLAKELLGEI